MLCDNVFCSRFSAITQYHKRAPAPTKRSTIVCILIGKQLQPNTRTKIRGQMPGVKRPTKIDFGLKSGGGNRTLSLGASARNLLQIHYWKQNSGVNNDAELDCAGRRA
jgi:hypothetical protein